MAKAKKEWPAMRYHPITGQFRVFQKPEDVFEGWVDSLAKVGKTEPEDDKPDGPTLEGLGITRKEALAFLRQDLNKKVPNSTTDAELARMVEPHIAEDE
jgi:hypothetical protein